MPAQQAEQYTGCELAELLDRIKANGGKGHRIQGLPGTYLAWSDVEAVKAGALPVELATATRKGGAGTAAKRTTRKRANGKDGSAGKGPQSTSTGPKGTRGARGSKTTAKPVPATSGDALSATVIGLPGIAPYPRDPRAEVETLACCQKHELLSMAVEYGMTRSQLPYRRKDIASMIVDVKVKRWNDRQLAEAEEQATVKHRGDELAKRRKAKGGAAGKAGRREPKVAPVVQFSHGGRT